MRIERISPGAATQPLQELRPLNGPRGTTVFNADQLGLELSELELPYGQDESPEPSGGARTLVTRLHSWWRQASRPRSLGQDAPLSAGDSLTVTPVGEGYHLVGSLAKNQRKDLGENPDALAAFEEMKAAAAQEGVVLEMVSYYRSYAHQKRLWEKSDKSGRWVARPGSSEHHTGLAIDIGTPGYAKASRKGKFEASPAYQWLREHGYRFGFVQSMAWESWHWRYDPQGVRESLAKYENTPRIPTPPPEQGLWHSARIWLENLF